MTSGAPSLYLCWVDAEGAAMERELTQGAVVIGRSSGCDLVIDDSAVSREHARVEVDGDAVVIHDLQSRNGTWVNGERTDSADLSPGDEIAMGRTTVVLMAF